MFRTTKWMCRLGTFTSFRFKILLLLTTAFVVVAFVVKTKTASSLIKSGSPSAAPYNGVSPTNARSMISDHQLSTAASFEVSSTSRVAATKLTSSTLASSGSAELSDEQFTRTVNYSSKSDSVQLNVHLPLNSSRLPSPQHRAASAAGHARRFMKRLKAWNCSAERAQHEFDTLCELYKSGMVTGNLCSPLCDQKLMRLDDWCGEGYLKMVMRVNCTDVCKKGHTVPAYLKTAFVNTTKVLRDLPEWQGPRDNADDFHEAILDLIIDYTKKHVGFLPFKDSEGVKVMWGQGQDQERDLQHSDAVWRSLTLLMRQMEYVLAKAFEDYRESCPPPKWSKVIPGPEFEHLKEREASWVGRAYGALRTLQFLQHLETALPDQPIACDSRELNFGICPDGGMRMIDVSDFFFNASTSSAMRGNSQCTGDWGCTYHGWRTCRGSCDVPTGKCFMKHSPNLEVRP
ncbi:hypothetical protein BaRGS_00026950 [Batillaria attramentaria]|uniref:FAM69 protein-kinase domain-containing protein n=1 Tax=Batillaria attramentaria TaxID=370345 RepID=A0ABD0K409_9CAEN